jgi:hypothetical protein
MFSALVTFLTAPKTEVTTKGDSAYSEVVRKLISLYVLDEYLSFRVCISFGQLIIFRLKFVLTANSDTGKPLVYLVTCRALSMRDLV